MTFKPGDTGRTRDGLCAYEIVSMTAGSADFPMHVWLMRDGERRWFNYRTDGHVLHHNTPDPLDLLPPTETEHG